MYTLKSLAITKKNKAVSSEDWTVNSLYYFVNSGDNKTFKAVVNLRMLPATPNITVLRRTNAIALYQAFLKTRIHAGEAPKGLDQAFAASVEISPSMWSQIKSARPISDKLARQIEHHACQSVGWLDTEHVPDGDDRTSPAETHFLKTARIAWTQANAREKRALIKLLEASARASQKSPEINSP